MLVKSTEKIALLQMMGAFEQKEDISDERKVLIAIRSCRTLEQTTKAWYLIHNYMRVHPNEWRVYVNMLQELNKADNRVLENTKNHYETKAA